MPTVKCKDCGTPMPYANVASAIWAVQDGYNQCDKCRFSTPNKWEYVVQAVTCFAGYTSCNHMTVPHKPRIGCELHGCRVVSFQREANNG